MDEASFSFNRMLAANQKQWNAAHYPSTPIPGTYATITKATNMLMDVVWLVAYVGMGACMSTGIWAPVSSHHTAAHATLRGERTCQSRAAYTACADSASSIA